MRTGHALLFRAASQHSAPGGPYQLARVGTRVEAHEPSLFLPVSHLSFLVNSLGQLNSFFDSHGLTGREVPYLVGWVVGTGSI